LYVRYSFNTLCYRWKIKGVCVLLTGVMFKPSPTTFPYSSLCFPILPANWLSYKHRDAPDRKGSLR
jgi:hypothetical protein